MESLDKALDLLQQLDALRPIKPEQEQRIWQKFRLDWNFHSNNLEGNSLSYGETKSLLLHGITARGKPLKDHIEITGHKEALLEIEDAVNKKLPLTESFLRQLHTLILKERYQVSAKTADGMPTKKWVEVGKYKSQPNHVETSTGEMFHFAEPFDVPSKMSALVQQANELQRSSAQGLLLAAKLHYDFVCIHPFDDGNGRMARILMNLVLMQHGFPPAIIKTQAKNEYLSALRQADGGQFDIFASYIAERVADSLMIMIAGAKGEAIDEPDDLDKKIALLQGSLIERQGGKPPPEKTPAVLTSWANLVFEPLLTEFIAHSTKFKGFYTALQIQGSIDSRHLVGEVAHDLEFLSTFLDENTKHLYYVANFQSLKMPGINPHAASYSQSIAIEFAPVSYKLDITGLPSKHLRYDAVLDLESIRGLLGQQAQLHIDHIEQRRDQLE